jgi:DNA-binding transcriptional LysR family regulator
MLLKELDLNKLHVFAAVVEHGGVGRAAAELGRTASAVSQSLSGLEDTLGVKLFDRIGKQFGIEFEGVVPTEEGWAIALHCIVCKHRWTTMRTRLEFEREATECPKAQTSKKHQPKGDKK